jgi:NAD-dependent SIR2 family protein deacetylase
MKEGFKEGGAGDLMLCLGSSLRVQPALEMAKATKIQNAGKLVIVTL